MVAKRLGTTRITRARARWYLLRFGGPLALLPSLLQPAAVVVTGIVIAVLVHHPAPLVGVLLVLAIVAFRLRRRLQSRRSSPGWAPGRVPGWVLVRAAVCVMCTTVPRVGRADDYLGGNRRTDPRPAS